MPLYSGGSRAVTFSPDSKRLVAVGNNGIVRIWDARQNHETTILSGHTDTVTSVTFSPDGSRIYSKSENEKLVWDVAQTSRTGTPARLSAGLPAPLPSSETGKSARPTEGLLAIINPNAAWAPPEVTTQTSPDGRWFVTTESNNVVLVDLEYKNTPNDKSWRKTKASFDPIWHQEQAKAATNGENWYAAVFHNARLLKHDPDSVEYYVGLQASYRRLTARTSAEIEALSRLEDVTGSAHGTFYSQQKKQIATTLPAAPLKSTEESGDPSAKASDSNHALYFDGASYADLGNPPFYKASLTVEGWIKPAANQPRSSSSVGDPRGAIFNIRSGKTDTALYAEVYSDGRLRVIHRNPPGFVGGINLFSQTTMIDGKWHHFAVVKGEDDKLHLYIDGSLEASSEETAADFGDASYPVFLGMNTERHTRYFRGLMDEVRFWKNARTRDEITSSMNSHVDPASPGLVAAYDFDQASSVRTPSQASGANLYLASIVKEALELPRGAFE